MTGGFRPLRHTLCNLARSWTVRCTGCMSCHARPWPILYSPWCATWAPPPLTTPYTCSLMCHMSSSTPAPHSTAPDAPCKPVVQMCGCAAPWRPVSCTDTTYYVILLYTAVSNLCCSALVWMPRRFPLPSLPWPHRPLFYPIPRIEGKQQKEGGGAQEPQWQQCLDQSNVRTRSLEATVWNVVVWGFFMKELLDFSVVKNEMKSKSWHFSREALSLVRGATNQKSLRAIAFRHSCTASCTFTSMHLFDIVE